MPKLPLALILAALLTACGGGGGSGSAPLPAPPPGPVQSLNLSGDANQVLVGGKPIALTATTAVAATVNWSLDGPGTLSASSGASVNYTPPASVAANTAVTVSASAGGVSKTYGLTVFPDPGAPGLFLVSGRLNSDLHDQTADGPVASARFRNSLAVTADPAGNLYVAGTCLVSLTRSWGLTLRKISTAGIVSTLASCEDGSWFGGAPSGDNRGSFDAPFGLASDRAGNLYTATYFFSTTAGAASNSTRAVYKISPQGRMTLLAGAEGSHTADLKDGNGASARFLTPEVIGFDSADNLYVNDKDGAVLRKISAAGEVTTVSALPASLNADLNGNTYRLHNTTIIRTTPAGVDSVIADVRTLPNASEIYPWPYSLVRTGPATYALLVSNTRTFPNEVVAKLVVAH